MQSRTIFTQEVQHTNATLLRRVLLSNALFSLISGLAFIFAAGPIARFLGPTVPAWAVVAIGVSFLPFVYGVYWVASQDVIEPRYGRLITFMDFTWVLGSYLLLFLGWSLFNVAGRWFIGIQAEVIFLFGVLQIIGLRRLRN